MFFVFHELHTNIVCKWKMARVFLRVGYVIAFSYIFVMPRRLPHTKLPLCVAKVGKVSVSAVVFALHFHR